MSKICLLEIPVENGKIKVWPEDELVTDIKTVRQIDLLIPRYARGFYGDD